MLPGARHITRAAALLAPALLLTACATAPTTRDLPDLPDWEARRVLLQDYEHWEFRGRIAVKAGDEGFNGSLFYEQDDERFIATLRGPLGVGTVRLNGTDQRIELTDNDGRVVLLEDPEQDLLLRYGWTIPVTSLRFWALGVPDPDAASNTRVGEDGLVEHLEQRGWTVSIPQYRESAGQQMPRRIGAASGEASVRLVIDQWLFFDR